MSERTKHFERALEIDNLARTITWKGKTITFADLKAHIESLPEDPPPRKFYPQPCCE